MYTEEDLTSAVKAGIFTDESVTAFRSHIENNRHLPTIDEEQFRLVTGFNDIFVVIACVLLLVSVSWIGTAASEVAGALAFTATAWGLAEIFVLRRRMALPAIVLLLAFVGGVLAAGLLLFGEKEATAFVFSGLLATAAAWVHWQRFKVPVTIAAGTAAAIGCVLAVLLTTFTQLKDWAPLLFLIAGVLAFSFAMRWDMSDTLRRTRQSDVAFWLHLLAAPLLVHPVFTILGMLEGKSNLLQATLVIALYIVMAAVSVMIDRRALMVSALAYVLYAFTSLLKTYGIVSLNFALTGLVIGSALLLLSAYWHPTRAYLIRYVPQALQARLPPLR